MQQSIESELLIDGKSSVVAMVMFCLDFKSWRQSWELGCPEYAGLAGRAARLLAALGRLSSIASKALSLDSINSSGRA